MQLTGAEIIVECLKEQGVDTVFGYPGGAILNVYDALYEYKDQITHVLTSHEQGASHAADGYARATGKVGVCLATSGPGATNLVTGIATAYMDSVPMVAITCNVGTPLLGKDSFQEVDITGIVMPITKHSFIVKDVAKLAKTIRRAFVIAKSGRPGPVLVDIPSSIQVEEVEWVEPEVQKNTELDEADNEALANAAEAINKAQNPVLLVGGGAINSGAEKELLALAEKADLPVVSTLMGLGVFPGSHKNSLGLTGMHGHIASNMAVAKADVLIVAGSRFSDRVTGDRSRYVGNKTIIQLDIDPTEFDKNVAAALPLIGDVKTNVARLLPMIEQLSLIHI